MIYHLFYPLTKHFFIFNLTKYITFRSGCAFITSFLIVMLLWKYIIKKLKRLKITEKVDMYGHVRLEALHEEKKGTPTMGGILVLFAIFSATLIWARWDNYFIWLVLVVTLLLGSLGLYDDFLKIKRGKGLSRSKKLLWQSLIGILLGVVVAFSKNFDTTWSFPFFKKLIVDIGYFYIFWAALMVVATSNAVNFTDGLDGLAIGALISNALIFGFLSYIVGHMKFASYLLIPYIRGTGELTIFCFSLIGAGLAFLWYNSYPAEVFMGDVGALALGGAIGTIALLIKQEFLLFISGGLFVIEALSVILQMLSVKFRGKKLFKAAPLHHHFQVKGWKEPKIIIRFWIVSIICAVLSLLTLKIR